MWLSGQDVLNVSTPMRLHRHGWIPLVSINFFEADSDKTVQALPVSREQEYIDYFYGKYKSRLAGYASAGNHSQALSFVFQNVYGNAIGVIALNEVVSPNRTVHIHHLSAFVLQSGNGTLMLLELCKADCFNIRLSANPVFSPNEKFSHMDFKVLSTWYEQFGFKGILLCAGCPDKDNKTLKMITAKTVENNFLNQQIPRLNNRFLLTFSRDDTCMEYFLCNRHTGKQISKTLVCFP